MVRVEGKKYLVHRLSFYFAHGRWPVPNANHTVTCPYRHCVEPTHLYEGTQKQNMQDKILNKRSLQPNTVLTELDVKDIRMLYERGMDYRAISRLYGVAPNTIKYVVLRETWKDVT